MPDVATLAAPPGMVISSTGLSAMGGAILGAGASANALTTAWPAANLAIYVPFVLEVPVIVYQISVENGATVALNLDVGIYDIGGAAIVRKGATAQSGVSVVQLLDITDTTLAPGEYFMAMHSTSATATYRCTTAAARLLRTFGVQQESIVTQLPATMTPAAAANAFVPYVCLHCNPTI